MDKPIKSTMTKWEIIRRATAMQKARIDPDILTDLEHHLWHDVLHAIAYDNPSTRACQQMAQEALKTRRLFRR